MSPLPTVSAENCKLVPEPMYLWKTFQQGRHRDCTLYDVMDSVLEDAEAVQSLPQIAGWKLNLIGSFHSVSFAEPTLICCSRSQSSHTAYIILFQSVKLGCDKLRGEFSSVILWFKVVEMKYSSILLIHSTTA